ncbi:hypothetical protein ACVIHD_000574 [Bradyrhizobium embrapense]
MSFFRPDPVVNMTDGGMASTVPGVFLSQLKNAPSVKGTFFPDEPPPNFAPANPALVDRTAGALVCSAIGRSALHGFAATVDAAKSEARWRTELNSTDALAAGRAIYRDMIALRLEGLTFSETRNMRPDYASAVANQATSPAFINLMMNRLIAREANFVEQLDFIMFKLEALDAAPLARTVEAQWKSAYPPLQLTWQTRAFIGPDNYKVDTFINEVNTAISRERTQTRTYPAGWGPDGPGVAVDRTTYYGEAVADFVKSQAAALGLATGVAPTNVH